MKLYNNFIAKKLGINIEDCFTPEQYTLFITGNGIGGNKEAAKLVDQTIRILTNTAAPTRQVNSIIAPGGYLNKWCLQNNAKKIYIYI